MASLHLILSSINKERKEERKGTGIQHKTFKRPWMDRVVVIL